MATTSTITVSAVPRNYSPVWHELYAKELRDGNSSIEHAEITGGESLIRRSHSVVKGNVEKHYESVEDRVIDADGILHVRKAGLTLTYDKGDPDERAATIALAEGFTDEVGSNAELTSLTGGVLHK